LALRVLVSESVVRALQPLQDSLLANEDVPVVLQALLHLLPLPLLLLDVVQQGLQAGGDLRWNSQKSFYRMSKSFRSWLTAVKDFSLILSPIGLVSEFLSQR
jgi:hypothetical protein